MTLGALNVSGEASSARPVALVGRIPVKVSLENGPIKPGDRVLPFLNPGRRHEGRRIRNDRRGRPRAVFRFGLHVPKILVFVNLGYAHLDDGAAQLASGEAGPTNAWSVTRSAAR